MHGEDRLKQQLRSEKVFNRALEALNSARSYRFGQPKRHLPSRTFPSSSAERAQRDLLHFEFV